MSYNLLISGKVAFPVLINRIKNARKEIIISMHIWRDDEIGNKIAEKILNAADNGVQITIIKDKVGFIFEKEEENKKSFFHNECNFSTYFARKIISLLYFRYLKKPGESKANHKFIKILNHPNITLNINKMRYDHSKYYLIDNKYLIMGSINIEDKEILVDKKGREYSDYMVEITSDNEISEFNNVVVNKQYGNYSSTKRFYINDKDSKIFEIKQKIIELIDKTKKSIDIEMSYWGDKDITTKIIEQANKGIAISIITSKEANIQNDYNKKVLRLILKKTNSRVKVYLSKKMVHSKLMCVDKSIFFLGSANYNTQGMSKVSELNILIEKNNIIFNKWLTARKAHLKQCLLITDYRKLQYNKLIASLEGFFC